MINDLLIKTNMVRNIFSCLVLYYFFFGIEGKGVEDDK